MKPTIHTYDIIMMVNMTPYVFILMNIDISFFAVKIRSIQKTIITVQEYENSPKSTFYIYSTFNASGLVGDPDNSMIANIIGNRN